MPTYQHVWGNYQPHWTGIEANLSVFIDLRELLPWGACDNQLQVSRDNRISTFESAEDLQANTERGKLFLEQSFFCKFLQDAQQRCQAHRQFFATLKNIDWKSISDEELLKLLAQAREEFRQTICYFKPTQEEGMHHLVEKIKQYLTPKDASLLMTPVELDELNQEQLDWHQLVQLPYSEGSILKHLEKYPWVVASHFTLQDVLQTMKQRYAYAKEHLQPLKVHQEKLELKEKQERILLLHPELKPFVNSAQQLALCRMEVKSCWAGTEFYTLPLFAEISKRTGEDVYDLWKYYVFSELKQLLLEKKALSVEEKARRKQCVVGLLKEGTVILKSGEEAENIAKQELAELYEVGETNEVKGTVANPGKVQGIARILQSNNLQQNNELRKTFKKGEILITQMTQPNIVDIAGRAGAIVTEEGGMLSHAAIISREFKVPCVVGTHIATSIFKDGDLVEVDAEKGIVRKIELNPEDFIPLFHGEFTTSYFLNEFWTGTSMARSRILVIQKEKSWSSFIDNKGKEMCLLEGLNLFQNPKLFEDYINEFEEAIKYSKEVLIPKYSNVPENVTKDELKNMFEFMKRYWYLYGFTENPHHDLAYSKMLEDGNSVIKNNLNRTYAAKVEGRKVMNAFFFAGGVIPNVIEFFSRKYFKDSESAMYLSLAELLALSDGKYLEQGKIEQRKNCTVLLSLQKNCIELPAQRGIELANRLMVVPQKDSVKGTIAHKGKTTGKAVIAPMLDNMDAVNRVAAKMHHGAVLITQTTSPELMILCQKASAIVADQGGMMSHAAIISRELKIPCIVGTQHATKIFKDGDMVEVDAEQGIVRKIDK